MNLVTTLPERPGFLHVIPVLDLFLLISIPLLLLPSNKTMMNGELSGQIQ